ncbi:MAG: hypothetical protein ACI4RL_07720, partial [Ruminococcus sp.]
KLKNNNYSITQGKGFIESIERNVSTFDSQELISTERKILKKEYSNNNINNIKKIIKKLGNSISVNYIHHYSPCVELELTKSQIITVSKLNTIQNIFYYNPSDIKTINSTDMNIITTGKSQLENLQASGIQYNIDQYNLTGEGVNVGIIDSGFSYDTLETYFSRINISTNVEFTPMTEEECRISSNNKESHTHGDYVSTIIGANGYDFKGAVKDCNMYFTNNGPNYTENVEWLIDKGCNIINACSSVNYGENNTYNQFAKWLDTIATRANVTFVLAVGNSGENGVPATHMSYNSIAVGSCTNNNIMYSGSSFSNIEGTPFKPDIVSQGEDAVSPYGSSGYTSSAAPLVTAAATQLCQYSSLLMNNPVALKSVLLNGATYLGTENTVNIKTDFNALSRNSGVGVLNAQKSLSAYRTMNVMQKSINSNNTTVTGTLYVSTAKKQVHVTLCSLKKNTIIGADETLINQVNDKPILEFEVTVTYSGSSDFTYYSKSTTDNKVSVIFTPLAKGYYNIVAHAISNVENNDTYAVMTYTSI